MDDQELVRKVEAMREKGFYLHLTTGMTKYSVTFREYNGHHFEAIHPVVYDENLGTAVMQAALKAMEGEHG